MGRNKLFNSVFQLPIDRELKYKAMYILGLEWGESISAFIRKTLFWKVTEYEKKNGIISDKQLFDFREK